MKKILSGILILNVLLSVAQTDSWCGTTLPDSYKQEYAARDRSTYNQQYAQRGGIQWVPVFYHIITKNDGTGGCGLRKVFESHCELNESYNPFNIGFYIEGIDTIKNTTLWLYQSSSLGYQAFNQYNENNVINIYLNGNLPGLCGFATFPNSAPNGGGVFMNAADCLGTATTTLPHEVGHYFGLLHTFETAYGVEYVDGSNCNNAGDLFCDTPADFLDQRTPCPYTGNQTDGHGDPYNPDESLYMSYFNDNCVYRFSPMEETEMNNTLVNDRAYLLNQAIPDLSPLDTTQFIAPLNGDTTLMGNTLTVKWHAIAGAQYYIFRIQSASSSIVYADTAIADTVFVLNNLVPNKGYKYRVKGISFGNCCSAFTSYNQIKTSAIQGALSVINPSCSGEIDGQAIAYPANGTAPYNISWSSGAVGDTVNGLAPGTYTVTITDADGEVGVNQFTVNDPAALTVAVEAVGINLNAYASGGTAPFTYTWSNGYVGPFNNNIPYGNYSVTVTDSRGCSAVESVVFSGIGTTTETKMSLRVFPNPSSSANGFKVEVGSNEKIDGTISVLNTAGEVLQQLPIDFTAGVNNTYINCSALASGIYFVRFSSAKAVKTVRVSLLK